MSMTDVKAAFIEALGSKATCTGATMTYEDGGMEQRLDFTIVLPDGETEILSESVPARADLVAHSRKMAKAYVAGDITR